MRKSKAMVDLEARLACAEREVAALRGGSRACDAVRGPEDAVARIRERCAPLQETFVVLLLDARGRVIDSVVTSLGTAANVEVHPRDVFRDAIVRNAHSIIVGHNHPSGSPDPSQADIDLTRRLSDAGRLLGIPVLDHVVVTMSRHTSLAGLGLMPG